MQRAVSLFAGLVLATGTSACGTGASTPPPTTAATSPGPATATAAAPAPTTRRPDLAVDLVAQDVRFAETSPAIAEWSEPLLDVYAPAGAEGLPLVVVLSPHGLTKDNPATVRLATGIAARGAVVVVANWSQQEDPAAVFEDPAVFAQFAQMDRSVAGCAVAFAAARAQEHGGDATRLVVVGELFGANVASLVVLGTATPYPGCGATDNGSHASGLVALNADWVGAAPFLDDIASTVVDAFTVWGLPATATPVPVKLVVTTDAIRIGRRCEPDQGWLIARDPAGVIRQRLGEVGAGGNGCVDFATAAEAMAREMAARGLSADVVRLTNPDGATTSGSGAQVLTYGQADLDLLVDTVMATADATGLP
jgi:hypothetical protein